MRALGCEMSDEEMATERWENEGGHVVRLMTLQIRSVTVEAPMDLAPTIELKRIALAQGAPCYAQII